MFDIGFSEFLVIGVVALIVIGPERLPGVARTLGHLMGRMQRYVNEVKSDIQREMELDELRKLRESVEASAREIEQSVSREVGEAEAEMREIKTLVDPATGTATPLDSGSAEPAPSDSAAAATGVGATGSSATQSAAGMPHTGPAKPAAESGVAPEPVPAPGNDDAASAVVPAGAPQAERSRRT